ncbi:carcinoembryonic antigen-related cell adhesion molecule 1-like [Artibeus jamaicensis]|uniref:carcinoembryonic antigen-related cell adhesion molecule 1-like n=1 Tax=Artibeus jamaicensis TaxID=9417 RepID=UPI00235A94D1|nr:carcinoembryonic antigen-related cell adhesion molecule 1-like [Artibeus jamaicensis]
MLQKGRMCFSLSSIFLNLPEPYRLCLVQREKCGQQPWNCIICNRDSKIYPQACTQWSRDYIPQWFLLFQKVTLQDTVYYTVQAISKDLQIEEGTGQLYGPDAPSIFPSDSHYPQGANLSLSCHAASNPPAQYSWLINGRPQQATQELFVANITVSDNESYTCLAHNPVTSLSRTTVRTITVSARNTATTEQKDTMVLTCLTNDTRISIWWLFRDQRLLLTERTKLSRDNSTLIIQPVRREDAGSYQCGVSSPISTSKSDPLRLDVQSK